MRFCCSSNSETDRVDGGGSGAAFSDLSSAFFTFSAARNAAFRRTTRSLAVSSAD